MKRLTLVVSEESAALEKHRARMVPSQHVVRYGDKLWCTTRDLHMEIYPETALHPSRHMLRMLDILSAERERFIIGTHSEAIISGIGVWIRDGRIAHSDVEIHIVEADGVRVAGYDADGALRGWPFGFFAGGEQ